MSGDAYGGKCPRCGTVYALGGAHGPGFCIDRQGIDIPCENCPDPRACAEDACPDTVARP